MDQSRIYSNNNANLDKNALDEDDTEIFSYNSQIPESYDEKTWTLGYLQSQFETLQLYTLFKKYIDKINYGFFSLFLILNFFLFGFHFILLIAENIENGDHLFVLLPDLIIYGVIILLSVIGLFFLEIIEKNRINWQLFSYFTFGIVMIINFSLPIYHDLSDGLDYPSYIPSYTVLLIIASYVFLGLSKNWMAAILGLFVTACHILTVVFVSYQPNVSAKRVIAEGIFLLCFNILGLYFRYLNEIAQRKSFLDRRDCIKKTHQLESEKQQEEQLMSSIIPDELIRKVKESHVQKKDTFIKSGVLKYENPFTQQLLEVHDDVTILFADIVNFTQMTKKLVINDLLETLNELFGRFDDASENLKVIRIKFLGDCYYCVSGLPPNSPDNPAEACVDLGLKMIRIIASVRQDKDLPVDMRIGIHTGRIICGIIGKIKYQFDIWSKDVDIANRMESEGQAGKVHITSKTRNLLKKPYDIKEDPKHPGTYLVSPIIRMSKKRKHTNQSDSEDSSPNTPLPRPSLFKKNGSIWPNTINHPETQHSSLTIIEQRNLDYENEKRHPSGEKNNRRSTIVHKKKGSRINDGRRSTTDYNRRTAFMSSNLKRYQEQMDNVDNEMDATIDLMSFSKKDQYIKEKEISGLLIFRKRQHEWNYVTMNDPMFKYYVLSQVVFLLCIYIIENLSVTNEEWVRFEFIVTQIILLFVLLPCTWTYFLHLRYVTKFNDRPPRNAIIRFFYRTSRFISHNFWIRLAIYTLIYVLFVACVFVDVIKCYNSLQYKDQSGSEDLTCIVPWNMTQVCSMVIIMTFIFLKIFIWIKLFYSVIITVAYICCVLILVKEDYAHSETFNPYLSSHLAHIINVVFITFTLHLIDRQTDYMNRLDYLWTTKLLEKKKEADEQQAINTNMLLNILPKHVAKIYLDLNKKTSNTIKMDYKGDGNELYYENHKNAVIMFASMIFDEEFMEDEYVFLILMNEYITIIDTLINRKEFSKVEKIKIAKWTYMAVCGLTTPGLCENQESHPTSRPLDTLLNLASNMFREFEEKNNLMYSVQLRIGICHGPIVAGVVGSKKPLYDIWGDAVNMASRMDSTGVPGKIQVLESTAEEIDKLGYQCELRGLRQVKGAGEVRTFFVKLDENFNLVRCKNNDD